MTKLSMFWFTLIKFHALNSKQNGTWVKMNAFLCKPSKDRLADLKDEFIKLIL